MSRKYEILESVARADASTYKKTDDPAVQSVLLHIREELDYIRKHAEQLGKGLDVVMKCIKELNNKKFPNGTIDVWMIKQVFATEFPPLKDRINRL